MARPSTRTRLTFVLARTCACASGRFPPKSNASTASGPNYGRLMFTSNLGLDPSSVPLCGAHAHPNRRRYAISGRRNSSSLADASRWDAAAQD
ncbi:unnamed protein product, partial [Iphiclides podalirius]